MPSKSDEVCTRAEKSNGAHARTRATEQGQDERKRGTEKINLNYEQPILTENNEDKHGSTVRLYHGMQQERPATPHLEAGAPINTVGAIR